MTNKTLTGRIRYRNHKALFGKPVVVLQHEWHISGREFDANDLYSDAMHHVERTEWQDARIEDVTVNKEPSP